MTTRPEPVEAPPWRSDMGPAPRVTSYTYGQEPLLEVRTQGKWRLAAVRGRQDWADGRVAYHVDIRLDEPDPGVYHRAYWWPQPGLRVVAQPGDRRHDEHIQGIDG